MIFLAVWLACGVDADGDGAFGADCDDQDAAVHPGALEVCNGVDDDCDGRVDVEAFDATVWLLDDDGDGYGGWGQATACERPEGFVLTGGDCADSDPTVHPGVAESCNGLDDDCDGVIDPDTSSDAHVWYLDRDGDGAGTNAGLAQGCVGPAGSAPAGEDCDDGDPTRYPGAPEVCDDGIENDCDTDGIYDCDAAECGGSGACGPVITSVDADRGPAGIVTSVAIYGAGFQSGTTGSVSVGFGSAGACAPVTIVNDGLLICDAPKSAPGVVDVTVTTAAGSDTLAKGFTYANMVYVADGKGATAGSLWLVDLDTLDIHEVGNMGYGIDGMAFAPDGTLYGVTSVKSGGAQVVKIDRVTGRATVLASVADGTGKAHAVADVTFVGTTMVGWSDTSDRPITIATTGAAVFMGTGTVPSTGGAMLYDRYGGNLYFFTGAGVLYAISPATGALWAAGLTSDGPNGDAFASMTHHNGTTYAIDAKSTGGYSGIARIESTGAVTPILRVSDYADAIASPWP